MASAHLEIANKFLAGLTTPELSGLYDLLAEDLVIELPYNFAHYTKKLVGKTQVINLFCKAGAKFMNLQSVNVINIYQTPEGAILRYKVTGIAMSTGRAYRQEFMTILELKNGLIAKWVDFFNPNEVYYATLMEGWRAQKPDN